MPDSSGQKRHGQEIKLSNPSTKVFFMKKTFSVRVVDKMNTYTHSESTCLTSGSFPVRETVGKVRSNETDFNLRGTGNISSLVSQPI
jgi:hypothetical protein